MWATFFSFCQLGWAILVQNRKATNALYVELEAQLRTFGFSLTEQHRKRIFFYTAQSAITNFWFSRLRGEKPTSTEIKTALYLGAFTPIADDLMDEHGQTFESLEAQQSNATASHVLFNYLLTELAPHRSINADFERYFKLAHIAQNESLAQLNKVPIALEKLEKITYNKGGYYTTLYRFALNHPPVKGEEEAIYTLGAILQVLNDLFDMHKDYHNRVQTLVTRTADISFIAEKLKVLEIRFRQQFMALDYPERNKRQAYRAIMAIVTRGHVALKQYQRLQGNKRALDIGSYPRKPLIVDMERPGNIWKNLRAAKKST